MKNKTPAIFFFLGVIIFLSTCNKLPKEMAVRTGSVSNIKANSADVSGQIIDFGEDAVQHGHCYAKSGNVSLNNSKTEKGRPSGFESFTSSLSNLEAGTKYYVRAYIRNNAGTAYGEEISFTTPQAALPTVTTTTISDISTTTATGGGNVTSDGGASVTARGVCWSTSQNPTTSDSKTTDDSGAGSFVSSISGLSSNTTYYVRAYATNSAGTGYGNQVSFTTLQEVNLPTVTTTTISDISTTTATGGGNVTSDGGASVTARGVCWSTSQNPTTSNNKTTDGSGTGSFVSSISGLSSNTTYYVRAYAINSAGTAYGSQVSFITSSGSTGEFNEVFNPSTGKTWMDRNLGATQVATSSTDANSYGDLYQWGRGSDGHEKRTSATTSTLSSSDSPGHGNFILAPNSPYDWRSPQNSNLWQGVSGTNNPCPSGYRLPTDAEWEAERLSWGSNNAAGAYGSPLKLPVAGRRNFSSGSLSSVGSVGLYWSGTVDGTISRNLLFYSSNAIMYSDSRAYGGSVRCLKD